MAKHVHSTLSSSAAPRQAKPPRVSLLALAQYLGALKAQEHAIDELQNQIGYEAPHGLLDRARLQKRQATNAHSSLFEHSLAVEWAILTGRAVSQGDAVAQVMLAYATARRALQNDFEGMREELAMLEIALESALRVIARNAGIKLASIGGRAYANIWIERWPDVDGIGPEKEPASDLAFDEPVPA